MSALEQARTNQRTTVEKLAEVMVTAHKSYGATPQQVVESLELLRYQLHRELDDLIDEAELKQPPAGNAWRARRYRELTVPAA